MRPARWHTRLTWTLALMAWLAQLCLPVAHATMVGGQPGAMAAWCGSASNAAEANASLPPEIRDALAKESVGMDQLAQCAKACTAAATPAPWPTVAVASLPPVEGARWSPAADRPTPSPRHALKPPSQGPPARA